MRTRLITILQNNWGLSNSQIKSVLHLFTFQKLKKGEYHTRKGDHHPRLSLIMEGYLRVFASTSTKEVTQWIASPDELITDLSAFIFHQSARWNIQCITEVEMYSLSQQNYLQLSKIIENWSTVERQFISSCFLHLEDRVFSFIASSAEERYLELFKNQKILFQQVPLNFIASMLGMSAETMSRIRSRKLENE
ncbi:Crp/Fnr family transcriptional regulator [Acidiluteibacter ferrifornacis]|uniref:Cyclic nucleotide-binding domain-containing protein n=1 Tax=Acidiluteibacter ferrifornacis TaxID=2692424 RepID=A0A6N9NIS3_9FLAO|nr:cyclic nucleotide-binding domain-containing protein [Acidiluteibacter ferrifornacis]NBG65754.1 cyclic nucleotide-binding domain-containing protein [Acidiluteibacter ferrifornacis]